MTSGEASLSENLTWVETVLGLDGGSPFDGKTEDAFSYKLFGLLR